MAYSGMLGLSMVTMDFARFGRVQDETYHATINFGVPFYACLELDLPLYEPDGCPLCAEGVALVVT